MMGIRVKRNSMKYIPKDDGVLLYFWSGLCGPCKVMSPIINNLYSNKLKIIKISTDQDMETADKYNIRSIPTIIILKDGKELYRHSGVLPESILKKKLKDLEVL